MYQKNKEIINYIIFGVLTTAVNWVIYTITTNIIGIDINIANIIAWFGAVLFAYVTNKLFVFESKKWDVTLVMKELSLFFGSRVLSGIVEIGGFSLLVFIGMDQTMFGIKGFVAKAFISVFVIVLNYVFSKLLVFKKDKADDSLSQ
ncbi:GtrA family protein [Breznakia pachnodae]|uniref:Flippase GtrA n=1 Tax=Breznakia pachnodae TaxID=265178 RepID=A0ABU0DYS9_9FIRM|nr:GtrA family protein [Breznakia pachnodae]MDQ0359785.1 putative flippase GtrA [Breznakia pachnodae]